MPSIVAEECSVLWVSYIVVNLQWVGVIRQVSYRERKAYRVMGTHIVIFGGPYVRREITRVAWLVSRRWNVVLEDIHRLPCKSVAILDMR